MKRESIVSLCCLPGVPVCSLLSVRTLILAGFLCLAQSINLHAQTTLSAGDIVFTAINTDNNDRFAFVALVDISEGTDIVFTDEGWTGSDFRGINEDTGIWTAPAGGITAGTVIEIEGATVTGGGTWQDEALDSLADGDQILAYQVFPGSTNFIAGIGAGAGSGNWIDTGTPDASKSYIPEPLGLGTNVVGFTSDNGYFSGLSTNTASGLARYISDDSNWTLDSITRVWPTSWDFEVNDELSAGDIVFTAINTDGPDRFAFVALTDIPANTAISFTDEGWTGTDFRGTLEETGIWFSPPAGIAAGTVIEIEGATVTGGGTWQGEPLVSLADGDQVLAYQGHDDNPHFLAGIGAGTGSGNWIDTDTPDANESYIPEPLGLGTNVVGFTSDNGYFSGLSTNTASGLARYISDDSNWTLDSITRVWPTAWGFEVNDELPVGDIAFVGYNADGTESFAFMAIADIPGNYAIAFTDIGWSNNTFITPEDVGTWISPGAGVSKGTVVTVSDIGSTMSADTGIWLGDDIGTINVGGDQLLAYQGHSALPHFLAGVSTTDWVTDGALDNETSYLPASLTLGVNAVSFNSVLENGYVNANKTTGSRWGYLTAINNHASWTRNDSGVTYPSWSFSVADTPSVAVGTIAFVAFQTDDPERFAFVTTSAMAAGTEIAFTDTSHDGTNFVLSLNEEIGVWTVPAGGLPGASVIEIEGTSVTGGGTMSGALDDLSVAGDQIFAFQGYVTNPVFVAGLCTKNWSTTGTPNNNNSYLPDSLTDGVNAVSWTAGGEMDNGYYSGDTEAEIASELLSWINDNSNWTRDDNTQTWPEWEIRITSGTIFIFR